jgi:hypothetical protein
LQHPIAGVTYYLSGQTSLFLVSHPPDRLLAGENGLSGHTLLPRIGFHLSPVAARNTLSHPLGHDLIPNLKVGMVTKGTSALRQGRAM